MGNGQEERQDLAAEYPAVVQVRAQNQPWSNGFLRKSIVCQDRLGTNGRNFEEQKRDVFCTVAVLQRLLGRLEEMRQTAFLPVRCQCDDGTYNTVAIHRNGSNQNHCDRVINAFVRSKNEQRLLMFCRCQDKVGTTC